ncbi:MAG TPA: hypothetical protein PKM88_08110, partial [bacterium]|nr:hypothetical protein [bacterium]
MRGVLLLTAGLLLAAHAALAAPPAMPPAEVALRRGLATFAERDYEAAAEFLRSAAQRGDTRALPWAVQALVRDGDPAAAADLLARAGDSAAAAALRAAFAGGASADGFQYALVRALDGAPAGRGSFANPTGIYLDAAGVLTVAALGSGEVKRFAADGSCLGTVYRGRPHQVTGDAAGNLYLTDFGNHDVVKLDAAGREVLRFGGRGREPGKFLGPEGIAVDGRGNIYVVDNGNSRVQKFSPDGVFLMLFGSYGSGD